MISRSLILPAAALALASCAVLDQKAPPPCPPIYILGDAGSVTKYREGPGRDLTDVEAEAEITGYQGACAYDEKGAEVEIEVVMGVKRGPADTDRIAKLDYFVAIPRYFPAPEAKAVFPVTVPFPEGANYVRHRDDAVTMRVPIKDGEDVNNYEIYIGFQTSPEELERNRKAR